MIEIDWLVGAYGHTPDIGIQVSAFLHSLRLRNDLSDINVFVVEREHRPMSPFFCDEIKNYGHHLVSCPMPAGNTCQDDTGDFADWMIENVGTAPWVILSHFDIVFHGDYISYVRSLMSSAYMIGNHHDGIMAFSRDAYRRCKVGFSRLDTFIAYRTVHDEVRIVPRDHPFTGSNLGPCLSLDVGELLAIRMSTLGLRHVLHCRDNEHGKSNLFTHTRRGSGHGDGRQSHEENEVFRG